MVTRALLAAWLALSLQASALAQPAGFAPPPLWEPPVPTRAEPGPGCCVGDVAWLPDVTYKSIAGHRPLKLDLYVPPPGPRPHPMVVWIHGGGFELGNPRADWTWGDWRTVLAELAARGYVVAGVSYRLSAEAPFPAALEDVQEAVRFLRQHAVKWSADPSTVIAWGLSAGGGLSALLGATCAGGVPLAAGADGACVQGVVDWFGPTDFEADERMAASPNVRRFLGCVEQACTHERLRAASALHQIRPGLPPYQIVQGGADPLVTPAHSQRLGEALSKAGVKNEVVVYPGLAHGFVGASPERLREILLATFAGIDKLARRTTGQR